MSHRSVSATALLALLAAPGLHAHNDNLATTRVASGLVLPIYATHAPQDFGRLFFVEKRGVIRTLTLRTGAVADFMDIDARVGGDGSVGSEQGLLGLAFHPDYQTNGFFYVDYTDLNGNTLVSRFRVLGDPATASSGDDTSELPILAIAQPQSNHNGGWLDFGPNDGYLYIATGDGGNFCDVGAGHTEGMGNAQDITDNLLGKILRIDVDRGSPYAIPADNPFVGVTGDDEIWAFGLRNPYRCSFDALTGDLYIGDVGQGQEEEIDFQPAASPGGENYGWRCMEGLSCSSAASGCPATTGCNCPAGTPGLVAPITAYTHNPPLFPATAVCSVIAGYVYRGACIPALRGTFFFADFCAGGASVWSFEQVGGVPQGFESQSDISPSLEGVVVNQVVSFGQDAAGELYIVDQGTGADGNIFRIVPLAEIASRSQAPNPNSYAATPISLGNTFTAAVDNNLAGELTSILFAFDTPLFLTLSAGQVLLCADFGGGELFTGAGLAPVGSAGGVDSFSAPVPGDIGLCGLRLYTQAIQLGTAPFTLSNAQDFTVGF